MGVSEEAYRYRYVILSEAKNPGDPSAKPQDDKKLLQHSLNKPYIDTTRKSRAIKVWYIDKNNSKIPIKFGTNK